MDDLLSFSLQLQVVEQSKQLAIYNQKTASYVSAQQLQTLLEQRNVALKRSGRVELGQGILGKLIETFCNSPYLSQENYEVTLLELQELFYHFKNESREQLSDDELLAVMKDYFDHKAHGSLEYLANTFLETLCRSLRTGNAIEDPDWDMEDVDDE